MFNAAAYFDGQARELAVAIQSNQLEQARRLMGGVDLNKLYRQNMTFLMWAIINQRKQALVFLLQNGANPNYKDAEDTSPISYVARASDQDYLRILLDHKADPNTKDNGTPVTIEAILGGQWENVILLLDRGASVNATDKDGYNIAMICGNLNFFDKVDYLMSRGTDIYHEASHSVSLALVVQEANPNPGTEGYKWQQIVKKKLESRGIVFPVPKPWEERQKQEGKKDDEE